MYSYTGALQLKLDILLQVIAQPMRLLDTHVLGHYQVQINVALASCLTGTQFMEVDQLTNML